MRAFYALLAFGQGSLQVPNLTHAAKLPFFAGAADSMLAALALLSIIGIFRPIQMLPLLLFELTWKVVWSLAIALPLWRAHQLTGDTAANVSIICGGAILCALVVPWGYVWKTYAASLAERWR